MNKKTKIMAAAVITMLAILTGCGSSADKASVPFAYNERIGADYNETISELKEAGFENVTTETVSTTREDMAGQITSIKIDGHNTFTKLTAYDKQVPVVIKYYELEAKEKAEDVHDNNDGNMKETETAAGEEDKKSFGDIYMMIGTAMSMSFGENYDMTYDDSGITVNVWQDGVAETAVLAKNGDKEAKETWDKLVESMRKMSEETKEKTMIQYGYGDKILVVNVLNDAAKDNTLLTVSDGVVFYDAVNGVNLTGQ